jgi:hypothetical protein
MRCVDMHTQQSESTPSLDAGNLGKTPCAASMYGVDPHACAHMHTLDTHVYVLSLDMLLVVVYL